MEIWHLVGKFSHQDDFLTQFRYSAFQGGIFSDLKGIFLLFINVGNKTVEGFQAKFLYYAQEYEHAVNCSAIQKYQVFSLIIFLS